MPVEGADRVIAAFRRFPQAVRDRMKDALPDAAAPILNDMRVLTPVDGNNPGPHARDGLAMIVDDDGLAVRIGLPNPQLASQYFWFRYLDGGTAGGEVTYRRAGSTTLHTMRVPARPALNIRQRALDGNLAEIDRTLRAAIVAGLDQAT